VKGFPCSVRQQLRTGIQNQCSVYCSPVELLAKKYYDEPQDKVTCVRKSKTQRTQYDPAKVYIEGSTMSNMLHI
jgi:hypothetical protein